MEEINGLSIHIDSARFDALFDGLAASKLRAAWKQGLKPSAKVLERGVLSQLYAKHPAAQKYHKEVKIKIFSKGGGYAVNLSQGQLSLGISKAGELIDYSHLYILRWLSTGTAERYTKRGFRRGRIVGSHFFREGVEQNINPAIERIGEDITKAFEQAQAKARTVAPQPQKI